MEDHFSFDNSPSMYTFFQDIDADDSGVEDLPFTNYVELDGIIERTEANKGMLTDSLEAGPVFDQDEDELAFIDDDKDEDYRPRKATNISKRGHSKSTKRRQYPNTCFTGNKMLMLTPEKQMISPCDTDSNSSMRHYARKDRTPNTIKKMMERHRESERVRHHSLNESLKDVCMRVPGYDPGAKETKVIQMQRIIGYECFLENTFRGLCDQLGVPSKLVLKLNTQFISDALNNTPIEDFYQPSSYRTSDADDEDDIDDQDQLVTIKSRDNDLPSGCRLIRSSSIEDNILKYPREKISSPTVDSTTDNIIRLAPLPHFMSFQDTGSTPKYITEYDYHSQWTPQTGFKPVESSQGMHSSQESGIKVETQSSLDDDCHFHEMHSLIEEGLYDDSEHFRTMTPSFMREETVSTSTGVEDMEEGFDLSSPIRCRESVFLHSPPLRGIWHSASKFHLPDKADTPGRKEMESVSPENILETKPKLNNHIATTASVSAGFHSTIRPMTEILSRKEKDCNYGNMETCLDLQEDSSFTAKQHSDDGFTRVSVSNPSYSRSNSHDKNGQLNNIGSRLPFKDSLLSSGPPSTPRIGGQIIKPAQTKNVKVRIIHASPTQRNLPNKLTSTSSVSSTSTLVPFKTVSPKPAKVVHVNPDLFGQTQQLVTKKENYYPVQENLPVITQLKKIPVPVMTGLQHIPVPVGSPLQCATGFGSPELKNKRKRYTPFRSPFLDRTNQDSDDESWNIEHKKTRLDEQEDVLRASRMLTRSRGETTSIQDILADSDIRNSLEHQSKHFVPVMFLRDWKDLNDIHLSEWVSDPIVRKIDHRRSTWMNGFMMFSQINRQKYLRDHPGAHISVIQKLLGHKWRTMSYEEQLPYREKANQYSGHIKQSQTCMASVADSSTGPQRENQFAVKPDTAQQEVEQAVLTIAPGYWHS